MKEIFKLKRAYLLLLFPISIVLIFFARIDGRWIEYFYIPYVYKPLSFVFGSIVSFFPFSVTEVLVIAAALFLIYYIIRNIKKPLIILMNVMCGASVLFFAFELCMGLNYYRFEAKEYLDIEIRESNKEALYKLCDILTEDLNVNRSLCETDDEGVLKLSDSGRLATGKEAQKVYGKLSKKYPVLKSANIKNKPLLTSRLFSAVMTTGIYIPFESNINVDVPEHTIPATMCHELTHFRGFMRENEANFLGYLACMESDRPDFRYSASLMAFEYAYPKLYKEDKDLAAKIATKLSDGVRLDIAAEDAYWEPYQDTVVSDVSGNVYDSYLNANGQTSGTKSYGEMVDLLIAYYGIE